MKNNSKKLLIVVLAVFLMATGNLYTVKSYAVNKKIIVKSKVINKKNNVKTKAVAKKNTVKPSPASKQNSVEIARKLLNNGRTKDAEALLINEVKLNPNNAAACQMLAEIYLSWNQLLKAKTYLNKAFKIEPENSELFSLTAKLMLKHSQPVQAEQAAKKAIELNPADGEAYLILGNIYKDKALKVDSYDSDRVTYLRNESLRYFKMATRFNSASPEAHIGLVKTYIASNQVEKAYDELLIAEELGFNNPSTLYAIGEAYYKLERYDKAVKFLQKPGVYNSGKYNEAHFILANMYEKLGDFAGAEREYIATLKNNPKYTEARVRLAQLKDNMEIASNFETNFVPVKHQEPKSIKELNTMADYYLIMDKLTQARGLYLKVLYTNPNDLRARVGLCELYYSEMLLGYFNNKEYNQDREFLEDDLGVTKLVIPVMKARMAVAQEISGSIKRDLTRIENDASQDPETLLNASRAAFLLGDYKLSNKILYSLVLPKLSDYEKFEAAKSLFLDHNYLSAKTIFLSLSSSYPNEVLDTFLNRINERYKLAEDNITEGQKLYKKKDYEAALYKYRRTMLDIPIYKPAYLNYAYTLQQLGDTKNAVKYLEIYSDLEDIFPAEKPLLYYKDIQELKVKWQNSKKAKKFKKKNKLPGEK